MRSSRRLGTSRLLLPLGLGRRCGSRTLPRGRRQAVERIIACVGPKTKLLAVSHVLWTTGQRLPVDDLKGEGIAGSRRRGASAGAIPVDVGRSTTTRSPVRSGSAGRNRSARCTSAIPRPWVAIPRYLAQRVIEPDGTFVPAKARRASTAAGWPLRCSRGSRPPWTPRPTGGSSVRRRSRRCPGRGCVVRADRRRQGTLVSFVPPGDPAAAAPGSTRRRRRRDLPGTGWLRASCGWWTN